MKILHVAFCLGLLSGIARAAQCPKVPSTGSNAARLKALTTTVNCLVSQPPVSQSNDPDTVYVDKISFSARSGDPTTPQPKTYRAVVAVIPALGLSGAQGPSVAVPGDTIHFGNCGLMVQPTT